MKYVVVGICSRQKSNGEEEYLLVRTSADYGRCQGFFQPVGGRMEEGEMEEEALKREIKEELGVDVTSCIKIVETEADVEGYRVGWWKCDLSSDRFVLQKDEIIEASFLTEEEFDRADVWPATRRFFNEFIWKKIT